MLRFAKKDNNRLVEKERIEKESKQAFDEAVASAQNCLQEESFVRYRADYEALQSKLFDELVYLDDNEFDPMRYGFRAKDIITKLKHIGSLLRGVKREASR